ncbi:MAG: GNAT family N-acetyltransferase [Caldilineaceae bacterium]|nr:GNAT family N-acetyltransferase [Caldilineaceae bacterium]
MSIATRILADEFHTIIDERHPLAALIDATQENIAAYYRRFVGLDGVVLHRDDQVEWFASKPGPPGSHVGRFNTEDDIDAAIDAAIDQVIADMSAQVRRWDWAVYRTCRPLDLGERLLRKGGKPGRVPWLLAALNDLSTEAPPDGFSVRIVDSSAMMADWSRVSAAGFETGLDVCKVYHDAYAQHLPSADNNAVHLIGYHGDEPVTSSTLLVAGGIAGIYDISTPPEHRRRGFGSAITVATLNLARAKGQRHVCCMASDMGLPIYQRLGFNIHVDIPEYVWE